MIIQNPIKNSHRIFLFFQRNQGDANFWVGLQKTRHPYTTSIAGEGTSPEQEDPAICVFLEQTGAPPHGVLCPDRIKCTGVPEDVFSFCSA